MSVTVVVATRFPDADNCPNFGAAPCTVWLFNVVEYRAMEEPYAPDAVIVSCGLLTPCTHFPDSVLGQPETVSAAVTDEIVGFTLSGTVIPAVVEAVPWLVPSMNVSQTIVIVAVVDVVM